MVLLMTEANNALSTTSHLPNFDEAADPGAPKPTDKLDVNSVILTLILLVVTYNATRNSAHTYHQDITTTGGRTDEYIPSHGTHKATRTLKTAYSRNSSSET